MVHCWAPLLTLPASTASSGARQELQQRRWAKEEEEKKTERERLRDKTVALCECDSRSRLGSAGEASYSFSLSRVRSLVLKFSGLSAASGAPKTADVETGSDRVK